MDDEELSSLIGRHATRHGATERLRAEIRTRVALQAAASAEPARPRGRPAGWRGWRGAGAGFGAGVAATLALVWLLVPLPPLWTAGAALPAELVADHVRALGAGPLFEVASSDRHTVRPWFQGRLDYAPPVFDLKEEGFALQGGRVERVGGAPVAALAYRHSLHVVDLYVWPADSTAAPLHSQWRGFNLLHWSDGAMQYWAVSDAEPAELDRLAAAWRARAAAP